MSHHIFETALGFMGIAWRTAGIARLCTPQRERGAIEARLSRHGAFVAAGDLPPAIAATVALLKRYTAGETVDFSGVEVDLADVDAFRLAIYEAARRLQFGETTTYGGLAAAAGHPGMAQQTGQALGQNPVPIIVPCHRILAAGGKIGGFSAPGGSRTKEMLLALEGVHVGPPPPAQAAFAF
ncbi:MAG: methylated-DNA--[protein]-cysteine S-methyltransferase [Rhizobiaceae bacterium]|nr:methylated-DNA--[protein]-cysteine S-methyltransferase [Rhizobiaceae bacterium]